MMKFSPNLLIFFNHFIFFVEMEKNCEDQIKKMAGDYENQLQKIKEDQTQR